MRVVAVLPNYPPHSLVGAWIATHRFLVGLVDRGHDVAVFAAQQHRSSYMLDGVKVDTGRRGRTHGLTLARQADVLITHAGDVGLGAAAVSEASGLKVAMVHGLDGMNLEGADLAVFNSHYLARVIPHECRSIVCHPPVPEANPLPSPGHAALIVNLTREKGVETVWRCAAALPRRTFLGVRGGYGRQIIPRTPNFEVLPPQRDMERIWARTRVLLMPSQHETWGMVGVEAMRRGIPVIAHPTPGLVESLGEAGTFVRRSDVAGWVAAIRRLDDPTTYQAASERGLARSAELPPGPEVERFIDAVASLAAGVAA